MKASGMPARALSAILATLILAACSSDPAPVSSPSAGPGAAAPNPSVRVVLKGIGVTESHESGLYALTDREDDIRLLVRITDGPDVSTFTLPPAGADTYQLTARQQYPLDVTVFSTGEVGDSLQIEIVAVEEDSGAWLEGITTLGVIALDPTGLLSTLVPSLLQNLGVADDPAGSYFARYSSLENWGAGQYMAVGDGDLRLWLDIEVDGKLGSQRVGSPF
jgi:hypothetical protein